MYSSRIKKIKVPGGGVILSSAYPTDGAISICGSVAGGTTLIGDGVAKIRAEMLLEGSSAYSKIAIQTILDSIGASLYFFSTNDRLCFSSYVRAKHLKTLLMLMTDLLYKPLFPLREFDIVKKREDSGLVLELQDTRAQALINLLQVLYAPTHPNFTDTTETKREKLKHLTSESLLSLHKQLTTSNSLVISLAGKTDSSKNLKLLHPMFKHKAIGRIPKKSYSSAFQTNAMHIATKIPYKENIDYVAGITTGITKDHKDFPALLLGVQILGRYGGFSGRLMKTVREIEGLTYGVYARTLGFTKKIDGYISIEASFAPGLFTKGRKAIRREIDRIIEYGVTETEIKKHAQMFEARSKIALSTSEAFARVAHDLTIDGKEPSYIDRFPKIISKLTADEVNKTLRRYLLPGRLIESAAGPIEKDMFQ